MRTDKMARTWKKIALALCVFAMVTGFTAVSAMASAKVKEVEYEGNGKVEISFKSHVEYGNVKATVKNAAGKKLTVKVVDKDHDDIDLKVTGLKASSKYTFRISGIRKKGESTYGTVKGSFKVPEKQHGITVKETEYDTHDREVSFDFFEKVEWKNPTVSISDGSKEYVKKIEEKSLREIEVKVKKLTKGKTYSYKISGIRKKGASGYVTLTGTFKA